MAWAERKEIESMYEYVAKSEYAPVRKELEKIINRTRVEMRKKYGLIFRFQLIGSGRRHLVTRIRGGNRGYDFDYNLIIPHPGKGYYYEASNAIVVILPLFIMKMMDIII